MKPPRREESSALRPWGGAQPPLAGWVESSPRRVSACPQGRATPQTPLHREMPSRAPKLSLYRVCAFASEARGLLMIWARGLTWAAERLRRMHPVAVNMQTSNARASARFGTHCRLSSGSSGDLQCIVCGRGGGMCVAGGAGGMQEGCPPAWSARLAPMHGLLQSHMCRYTHIFDARARARRATLLRFCAVGPIFYRLYSYLYSSFPKLRKESSSKMLPDPSVDDEIRAAEC